MNVYFYAPEGGDGILEKDIQEMLALLKRADLNLSTNRGGRIDLGTESREDIESRGALILEAMHALILEASVDDPQIGYLLAFGLTQKIPVLLLVGKGQQGEILRNISLKKLPKHVQVERYTHDAIHAVLEQFLGRIANITVQESPDIKFTLRLTRTEERYLEYRTRGSKKRKADFLRELLDGRIADDEQFRAWLKKRQ